MGLCRCRMGLLSLSHGAAASVAWGCSLCCMGLQSLSHGVAASIAWGCRLECEAVKVALPWVSLTSRSTPS